VFKSTGSRSSFEMNMCASWTTTEAAALQASVSRSRAAFFGGMGEEGERRKVGVFSVMSALGVMSIALVIEGGG
jgi:hypothetical protein